MTLKGKTALITGSAKRIGRSCALRLAREGAEILIHYNNSKSEAEELAETIRAQGQKAWTIEHDLSLPESGKQLMKKALSFTENIDYLVNSASMFPPSTFKNVQESDFAENLQVNALSPFFLSRAFAEESKTAECIINFLDTRILDNDKEHLAYHISKRVLFSLTRMLSEELAPQIRVNAVAPGLVIPPPGESYDYLKKRINTNPLHKIGTLDQVSDSLLFLISNTFITGQVLFVDGGRHLKRSFYGL
jgi:NAD(P)-dependent dehydrogenase (short-subunit alcohol dehydrogenase family)